MSYLALQPDKYLDKIVDGGQCVGFVRAVSSAPPSSLWKEGAKVSESIGIARGTVIATFQNGNYANHTTGNHAAIYLSQDGSGIRVIDQRSGQLVQERTIHKHSTRGPNDDAEAYSIVE